jgi:hypothetical protein
VYRDIDVDNFIRAPQVIGYRLADATRQWSGNHIVERFKVLDVDSVITEIPAFRRSKTSSKRLRFFEPERWCG